MLTLYYKRGTKFYSDRKEYGRDCHTNYVTAATAAKYFDNIVKYNIDEYAVPDGGFKFNPQFMYRLWIIEDSYGFQWFIEKKDRSIGVPA